MESPIYHVDCNKVLFGTVPGKKKDTQAFVEAQIQQYFDIPKNCHYRIEKAPGIGFHFEIQEDPNSGSVLKEILKSFKEGTHHEFLLFDNAGNQYQIYQRSDETLRTFFLSGDETTVSPDDKRIKTLSGKSGALRPYFSKTSLGVAISLVVFLISLVPAGIAASVAYTQGLVDQGYQQAVLHSPFGDILDPTFSPISQNLPLTDAQRLTEGWQTLTEHFQTHPDQETIGKLEYQDNQWTVN